MSTHLQIDLRDRRTGTTTRHSFDLRPGTTIRIGRHPTSDLCLTDPLVSSNHAELEIDDSGVHLRDLGSKNGIILAGRRSLPHAKIVVTRRLCLEIGAYHLEIFHRGNDRPAAHGDLPSSPAPELDLLHGHLARLRSLRTTLASARHAYDTALAEATRALTHDPAGTRHLFAEFPPAPSSTARHDIHARISAPPHDPQHPRDLSAPPDIDIPADSAAPLRLTPPDLSRAPSAPSAHLSQEPSTPSAPVPQPSSPLSSYLPQARAALSAHLSRAPSAPSTHLSQEPSAPSAPVPQPSSPPSSYLPQERAALSAHLSRAPSDDIPAFIALSASPAHPGADALSPRAHLHASPAAALALVAPLARAIVPAAPPPADLDDARRLLDRVARVLRDLAAGVATLQHLRIQQTRQFDLVAAGPANPLLTTTRGDDLLTHLISRQDPDDASPHELMDCFAVLAAHLRGHVHAALATARHFAAHLAPAEVERLTRGPLASLTRWRTYRECYRACVGDLDTPVLKDIFKSAYTAELASLGVHLVPHRSP
ncbi:MAG: FHA domain-containing protein [Myxococcales bacterium]|nr:FHA domain-containing protein [Myxococcales bacterium]